MIVKSATVVCWLNRARLQVLYRYKDGVQVCQHVLLHNFSAPRVPVWRACESMVPFRQESRITAGSATNLFTGTHCVPSQGKRMSCVAHQPWNTWSHRCSCASDALLFGLSVRFLPLVLTIGGGFPNWLPGGHSIPTPESTEAHSSTGMSLKCHNINGDGAAAVAPRCPADPVTGSLQHSVCASKSAFYTAHARCSEYYSVSVTRLPDIFTDALAATEPWRAIQRPEQQRTVRKSLSQ